jgi:D-amino peptidase
MVGQHAMIHAPGGNMDHSWDSRHIHGAWLNGQAAGEIAFNTILAGYYKVPMVLLTGDEAACKEMNALVPNAVTVAVKEGISRAAAKSLSPEKARQLIRAGAQRAMARISEINPYFVIPPYTMVFRYHELVGVDKHHLPENEKALAEERKVTAGDFLELFEKGFYQKP